jgi:hypothetical protein
MAPARSPALLSLQERMGDPRRAPGFGQIDLDLVEDPSEAVREPALSEAAFGELDFDVGESGESEEPPPPPSTSRVFNHEKRATRRNMEAQAAAVRASSFPSAFPSSVHEESTRIVRGDALSAITRPPPASPLREDGNTRAWADIDEALLAVGEGVEREEQDAPPSSPALSRSGHQPAPSGSGVATHDRVAAMRELYANGDADGALALASTLGDSVRPGAGDHPDASIVVEFGEQSVEIEDPFGGLIPLDDDLAAMPTVGPPAMAAAATTTAPPAGPAANLTLTERQSIPRVLKSMAEVSKLKIDHRAGFLLAHVDGMQTLEEILDICAMPPAEALELIANLKAMGVIEFE